MSTSTALEASFPCIEADLARVQSALAPTVEGSAALSEVVRHLIGGVPKLVRPTLTLTAAYLASDPAREVSARVVDAAVAIEFIHVGTMHHDDVMDEADSRRARPSVNARWGNAMAILGGNYLLASAAEIAARLGAHEAGVVARTFRALCRGQMLETAHLYDPARTEESYLEAISGKTAALLAASCQLGALEAEADGTRVEALTRFGRHFGIAFQINDDVLDLTETAEALGKPAGKDIAEGVYTVPVLYALRHVSELRALLTPPVSADDAERARALTVDSPGPAEAAAVAQRHLDLALRSLAAVAWPEAPVDGLVSFARGMLGAVDGVRVTQPGGN